MVFPVKYAYVLSIVGGLVQDLIIGNFFWSASAGLYSDYLLFLLNLSKGNIIAIGMFL